MEDLNPCLTDSEPITLTSTVPVPISFAWPCKCERLLNLFRLLFPDEEHTANNICLWGCCVG